MLCIGVALGVPFSLAAAKSARAVLFGIQPYDPATLIAAGGLLAIIAMLATAAA
jgi:hypothetical protein